MNPELKKIAIAILLLFNAPQLLFATTVLQVDIDYLLNKAMLIFEGEVISSEAKWNHDKTGITTYVTFRVSDVIKGEGRPSSVIIGFLGGSVGETGLHVSAMVYPPVGERGIYFLENPGKQLVNPLVGWGQGHFRIMGDSSGKERVVTEGGAPVLGLDVAEINGAGRSNARGASVLPFSHGVARGVRTGKRDDALSTAMDKRQFKEALKSRLATFNSNTISTPGSAGR